MIIIMTSTVIFSDQCYIMMLSFEAAQHTFPHGVALTVKVSGNIYFIFQLHSNGLSSVSFETKMSEQKSTVVLIKQFLFRKTKIDNNNKHETLTHKFIGYTENISTMVERRNIIFFL